MASGDLCVDPVVCPWGRGEIDWATVSRLVWIGSAGVDRNFGVLSKLFCRPESLHPV